MASVLMQQSVSVRTAITLIDDILIRNMILYQKEALLHEKPDPDEYNIPQRFIDMPDDERRGFVRALRWVITEEDLR